MASMNYNLIALGLKAARCYFELDISLFSITIKQKYAQATAIKISVALK